MRRRFLCLLLIAIFAFGAMDASAAPTATGAARKHKKTCKADKKHCKHKKTCKAGKKHCKKHQQKHEKKKIKHIAKPPVAFVPSPTTSTPGPVSTPTTPAPTPAPHVLLLSIDGLHASDLAKWTAANPDSALASLASQGLNYTNAQAPFPSDSFPGLLALVTGGTPRSTGVYYDNSYDRSLYPPGSNCTGPVGANALYDESIDKNFHALDGGGGFDTSKLPLAKSASACTPVTPHEFLRVNTIFNVAHDAGLRTAWSDKHRAYDLVNGHQGGGVDDLYTPEIASNPDGSGTAGSTDYTGSEGSVQLYDDTKVKALLNEIQGKTHDGSSAPGVPAIFGMNFQAVSVGEKLPASGFGADPAGCPGTPATACPFVGGYDAAGNFTGNMYSAISFVDRELASLMSALKANGLSSSTEIILTAKHGQSPIDATKLKRVDDRIVANDITSTTGGAADGTDSLYTNDDGSFVWLSSALQSKTAAMVSKFKSDAAALDLNNPPNGAIDGVIAGDTLKYVFGDPATDPRVPDAVLQPKPGGLYSLSKKKVAEHGGGSSDDRHVALIVMDPHRASGGAVSTGVQTTGVPSTILQFLGLDPNKLQSVQQEHTGALPTP